MPVVLYNPTNETFRVTYAGRNFPIEPEDKVKVDDACGRHLLNNYAQRGLCSLDFGDEANIKDIAERGREANRRFKLKQIENYNQRNEERKAIGLPFLVPTKTMIEYARELGLKLSEPYRVEDVAMQETKSLREENAELRGQIAELKADMGEILAAIKASAGAKTESPEVEPVGDNQQGAKTEISEPEEKDVKIYPLKRGGRKKK